MKIETFRSSVIWYSLGLILNRIKYVLLSIIILTTGPTNLAIFYITINLVNEFASLVNRLVGSTYNRFFRDEKFAADRQNFHNTINNSLAFSLALGIFGAIFVFLLASPIATLIKNPQLTSTIKIMALAIPFIVITNQIIQILSLRAKIKEAVIFQYFLESTIVLSFAYLAIIITKSNILTVLVWQLVAIVLSFFFAVLLLYLNLPQFRARLILPEFKTSPTIIFNSTFVALANLADIMIIGAYQGASRLGQYIALLVAPHLIYATATSIFPMFIHTASGFREDTKRVSLISQKVLKYILALSIPLSLLILLYPQETLRNIIRIHISVDVAVIRLLALAFFAKTIAWVAGQILIVSKKDKINMRINVVLSAVSVPLFLLFASPMYGFLGVAYILLGTSLVDFFTKTALVYKLTDIKFISYQSFKMIALGILIYILISSVIFINFRSFLLLVLPSYFLVLILLKCFDKKDLEMIKKIRQTNLESQA